MKQFLLTNNLCRRQDYPSTDMLLYSKLTNLQLKLSSWKKDQHNDPSYFNNVTKIQWLCLQLWNSTIISTSWKACTNKQVTWQQHPGKITGEIWNSAIQATSNIKLYQRLVESLAPLHQITVNKEKLTDLTGLLFDHLSVPCMGSLFCKVRIFKEHLRWDGKLDTEKDAVSHNCHRLSASRKLK